MRHCKRLIVCATVTLSLVGLWPLRAQEPAAKSPAASLKEDIQAQLHEPSSAAQLRAIERLRWLDAPGRDKTAMLLPLLTTVASNRDMEWVQERAVVTLMTYGTDAQGAVPTLCTLLADSQRDSELRKTAAYALGLVGANNPAASLALAQAVARESPAISGTAVRSLMKLPGQLRNIEPLLLQSLHRVWPAPSALPGQIFELIGIIELREQESTIGQALRGLEQSSNLPQTAAALITLQCAGRQGDMATPWLLRLLQPSHETYLRLAVLDTLQAIGLNYSAAATQGVLHLLSDPDSSVAYAAQETIDKLEPQDKAAVVALSQGLNDADARVRGGAAHGLTQLKGNAKPALGAVIQRLNRIGLETGDANQTERTWNFVFDCITVLEQVGAGAPATANALLNWLAPEARLTQVWSVSVPDVIHIKLVETLLKVGVPNDSAQRRKATQAAVRGLGSDNTAYYTAAARLAAAVGPEASPTVPLLLRALDPKLDILFSIRTKAPAHPDYAARKAAIQALGSIGPAARAALPRLSEIAATQDDFFSYLKAEARQASALIQGC